MNDATSLTEADLPMGKGCPSIHPKKQQLSGLIEEHAPEYARAPQSTGFYSNGRFIRSKTIIITDVINELMPDGAGRYMIKRAADGLWVPRMGFDCNTRQVRNMIQERFNKLIKSWDGKLLPLPARFNSQLLLAPQGEYDPLDVTNNNKAGRGVIAPSAKNVGAAGAGKTDWADKQKEDEGGVQEGDTKTVSIEGNSVPQNVFLACNITGATAPPWKELLTTPIRPNELRLSDVARSFAYFGDDRRLLVNAKNKSGRKISVYQCQSCTWTVKFVKRKGEAAKGDPWYLDSWGKVATAPSDDASPSKHDDGCHPVEILQQGDILRNSVPLRDYLLVHRDAKRKEIESFMMTMNIDVRQMGKGSFYDARNHILSQLDMDAFSLVVDDSRSASSSEVVRQILGGLEGDMDQHAALTHDGTPITPFVVEKTMVDLQHGQQAHSGVQADVGNQAQSPVPRGVKNIEPSPSDVPAHHLEPIHDHHSIASELHVCGQGSELATVDENTATDGLEEGTTASFGSSLHLSREGDSVSTNRSTSTTASETLRRMTEDLLDSASTATSSLTPSEEYMWAGFRSAFPLNSVASSGFGTVSIRTESSIGTFSASNTDKPDTLEAKEKRSRSGNTIHSTEPPARKVRFASSYNASMEEGETHEGLGNAFSAPDSPVAAMFDSLSLLDDAIFFHGDNHTSMDISGGGVGDHRPRRKSHQNKDVVSGARSTQTSVALTNLEIAVRHGDMSTGLENVGGTSVESMLFDLADGSLTVFDIKRLLDEFSDRAINEDMRKDCICRAIRVVSNVMKRNLDNKDVLFKGFTLAIQLCASTDSIRVSTHFVAKTIKALRWHSNDAELLYHGFWLLRVLVNRDTKAKSTIAKVKGIELVLNGMRHHSNDADIQYEGCKLLGQLAFANPKNKHAIAAANGSVVILQAMRRHEQHLDVQEWGCAALRQLTSKRTGNSRRNARSNANANLNGIDLILQAMRQLEQHADIQERGCSALGQLAAFGNPHDRRVIADADGIDLIVKAMQRHGKHTDVQRSGCFALASMVAKNEDIQLAELKSSGVNVVQQAMLSFPETDYIQHYGGIAMEKFRALYGVPHGQQGCMQN